MADDVKRKNGEITAENVIEEKAGNSVKTENNAKTTKKAGEKNKKMRSNGKKTTKKEEVKDKDELPDEDDKNETQDIIENDNSDANYEDMSENALDEEIKGMSDEDLAEYLDEPDMRGVDSNVIDVDDFNDSDDAYAAEFYQSQYDSNDNRISEDEYWNVMKSIRNTGKIVPVRIVGTEIFERKENGSNRIKKVVCAFCKMPEPYDIFPLYVSFFDLFTMREKQLFSKKRISDDTAKDEIAIINQFIGGIVEIRLTEVSSSTRVCFGSRSLALAKRERQFFNEGIMINGKKEIARKGSIIRGCKINRVTRKFIGVDICGVPTVIPIVDLSWQYIQSAKDKFKPGGTVDVKIMKITQHSKPDYKTIRASVKECAPNPTLPALENAAKNLGFEGEVLGKVMWENPDPSKFCYHIYTAKGYNALALSQKNTNLDDSYGKLSSPQKRATIGSDVRFHPTKRLGDRIIGYIVDVF